MYIYIFIWKAELEKDTHTSHPLFQSPNGHNNQDLARQWPVAQQAGPSAVTFQVAYQGAASEVEQPGLRVAGGGLTCRATKPAC